MFGGAMAEPIMPITKQAPPRSQSPEVELNEIVVAAPDAALEKSAISAKSGSIIFSEDA